MKISCATSQSQTDPQYTGEIMFGMSTMRFDSVKYHSYRTAVVEDVYLRAPRETARNLELKLAKAAGVVPDNHVVYEVVYGERTKFIMFHDSEVVFGYGLRLRTT